MHLTHIQKVLKEVGLKRAHDKEFMPDERLKDNETVSSKEWTIRAIHTPGHTSNHLCYSLEEEKALFTGDHVMGWATTVIVPPDGNMDDYVSSLKKNSFRKT